MPEFGCRPGIKKAVIFMWDYRLYIFSIIILSHNPWLLFR